MFILTRRTAPRAARTTFSMIGLKVRQGPHQGAQKSTRTGCLRDASRTSLAKVCVVVSMTRSSPAAAGAGGFVARADGALIDVDPVAKSGGGRRLAIRAVTWRVGTVFTISRAREPRQNRG